MQFQPANASVAKEPLTNQTSGSKSQLEISGNGISSMVDVVIFITYVYADQWNILRILKCDMAQGYYFSKPILPNEVERFLNPQNADIARKIL